MPITLRERVPYSAIVDRPRIPLPHDVRLIVWVVVKVENWDIRRPMPRAVLPPPMGNPLVPDLPNWAWHEYGMRVGFWRIRETMLRFKVTPTRAINGSVCEVYPRIAAAALEDGWEFMGHGWLQGPMHALEDQRVSISALWKRSAPSRASSRGGGRLPVSPRRSTRSTCLRRRASNTSPTGYSTISR